jgi:hypothetical protein
VKNTVLIDEERDREKNVQVNEYLRNNYINFNKIHARMRDLRLGHLHIVLITI